MGNFSQNPDARATDAIAKHYVGVRIQQAVPLLDADWNLLEDLRRREVESVGDLFIGDGVPVGSDGFHIGATAAPNDFTIAPGVLLAGGKLARNEGAVTYTTQPNFGQPGLDTPLLPLITPATTRAFLVVLDVWEREVDSDEDPALIDNRIGVETAVRVKREWAVRVLRDPEDLPLVGAPPPGHVFVKLARLSRVAADPSITAAMIVDLRDTQLTLLRRVDVRDSVGNVIVDNARFEHALTITRTNVNAFTKYITTQFNAPSTTLVSVEVLGLAAAAHIAHTVEAGLAPLGALSMANQGALRFLQQLYDAQQSFMTLWRDFVLKLGGAVKKYASYQVFIGQLDDRLNKPAVGSLTGLLAAINASNLLAATEMQEEIARLIGSQRTSIARGSIQVSYSNAPPGNVTTGIPARLEYKIKSFTTQADTYSVSILPVAGWPRVLVDIGGNPVPNNKISIGASGDASSIFVNVTPQTGSQTLQLEVKSDSNPGEIDQITGLITLTIGAPFPLGDDQVQFQIETPNLATINAGIVTVNAPVGTPASVGVRIFNSTGQTATFDVAVDVVPGSQVGNWTISRSGGASIPIANGANGKAGGISITRVDGTAVSVQARYTVSTIVSGSPVTAQVIVPIVV
jgi:uncharacterized protein DUF6519